MKIARLILAFFTFAAFYIGSSCLVNAATKPNIVFVLIDDMGARDVGCTGSTYHDTPHIDKLAAEGVLLLNAYSAAPICSPSRGAIWSGKNPARTQLTAVFDRPGPDDRLHDKSKYQGTKDQYLEARHRHALPRGEVILAAPFAEAGYTTGFFGKWHIGSCPGYYPNERGFQVADSGRESIDGNGGLAAEELTDLCVDFIKSHKDKPFLAVLSHYIVHTPIRPKLEKVAKYEQRKSDHQNNPQYAAFVESVDESVAKVLKNLRELGLEEDTMVIFTSDNGGLTLCETSNYPLMGGKSFPFEGGLRVPLIIKWPGKIKPGVRSEPVIGMDFYPTMLAAAGLPLRPEQHVDGVNLMPLLTEGVPLKERSLVFHHPHYTHASGPFTSIIDNGWKLIRFYNDATGAYLLYHLAEDPNEQNELAAKNPEKVKALQGKIDTYLAEMKAEMPKINPAYDPNTKSKQYNLKFTKGLAETERKRDESRMQK